jgi:SAM-dependent methyltransferase
MELAEIDSILRKHSQGNDPAVLEGWLVKATLSRLRDWVPRPAVGERRLLDIGCYQPTIGYYAALGWREITGIAKEEGECISATSYETAEGATAHTLILDVEKEEIPIPDASIDVVLMMEILEHFGLDPMHALAEANRVLRLGGLIIISTPNASSRDALWRIARGYNPHLGLEFSGYSTNRHNRLYDCNELHAVATAAGFDVELCTSRSYRVPQRGTASRSRLLIWEMVGTLTLRRWRQVERGDYLFLRGRKTGSLIDRYPRVLYWRESEWPQWFNTIRERAGKSY